MPLGLVRFQQSGQSHFVTFSCYRRQPHLQPIRFRNLFVESLERVRLKYRFRVYGYVVMPEHVHLLVSEPAVGLLATALQALKISVARQAMQVWNGPEKHAFWQKRYYDHNVRSHQSFANKLDYIHRNPVKRGLVAKPEDWAWSSFRHYAFAEFGSVEIESEWTAARRNGRVIRLMQLPGK
jgi:putative transposase